MEFKVYGENDQEDFVMEVVVKFCCGFILGKYFIFKMYFFLGQKIILDYVLIIGVFYVCKVSVSICGEVWNFIDFIDFL